MGGVAGLGEVGPGVGRMVMTRGPLMGLLNWSLSPDTPLHQAERGCIVPTTPEQSLGIMMALPITIDKS